LKNKINILPLSTLLDWPWRRCVKNDWTTTDEKSYGWHTRQHSDGKNKLNN
jgi:hypothetical protein